jgi:hypothetical protein
MKAITHSLAGFVLGLAFLAAIALVTGCGRHKPKPVHVPLVAYTAHVSDKDCKRIGTDNPPRFRCNNVVLDPREINAKNR